MARQAVALEIERFGHPAAHAGGVVEHAVGAVLGVELLAGGEAPENVAALDEERAAAALGGERRRGQAVVAGADDDDVVVAHSSPDSRRAPAASCPGAPMMPPPGCVPEPHIQKLSMGVL